MIDKEYRILLEKDVFDKMEEACSDMGIPMEDAFAMFARKVGREKRIPFRILPEDDPFFCEENMESLRQAVADIEAGINVHEHELIDVDDDESDSEDPFYSEENMVVLLQSIKDANEGKLKEPDLPED